MPGAARREEEDQGIRGGDIQQMEEGQAYRVRRIDCLESLMEEADLLQLHDKEGCSGKRPSYHAFQCKSAAACRQLQWLRYYQVEGPRNRGTVNMHLVKYVGRGEYEYKYFFVDVNGQRIHLEHPDDASQKGGGKKGTKLFGIQWS